MKSFHESMLRPLTKEEQESFRELGYLVYKSEAVAAFRQDVIATLRDISLHLLDRLQVDTTPLQALSYEELIAWCQEKEKDHQFTRLFYEMYQSMSGVIALIDHPLPLYLARAAGIRYPVAGTIPTIRIDRPGVTKYLTRPHQDFWYSLIADRSVVLWQPIIGLNRDMGLLGVVPGSHKEGFHPFEDEGAYTFAMRNDYPDHSYVECEIATDEILVFDQFLVHRSGDNNGRLPRVTMQLRYNDLEAMAEVVPTFTAVTSKAVVERQKRLLAGTVLPLPGARRSADA